MNSESVDIRITNEARIRLLASADHDHCHAMANECHGFITSEKTHKLCYCYLTIGFLFKFEKCNLTL
jgi:hypothetical protein